MTQTIHFYIFTQENENICLYKDLCGCSNFICNCPKLELETIQVSPSRSEWINRMWSIHMMEGIPWWSSG